MWTCQKKLAFVENSNSNNYHVYMLWQCASIRIFQSMIITYIIIQAIHMCQHILRPFTLLVLKRDRLFLVIYVPAKYILLQKNGQVGIQRIIEYHQIVRKNYLINALGVVVVDTIDSNSLRQCGYMRVTPCIKFICSASDLILCIHFCFAINLCFIYYLNVV